MGWHYANNRIYGVFRAFRHTAVRRVFYRSYGPWPARRRVLGQAVRHVWDRHLLGIADRRKDAARRIACQRLLACQHRLIPRCTWRYDIARHHSGAVRTDASGTSHPQTIEWLLHWLPLDSPYCMFRLRASRRQKTAHPTIVISDTSCFWVTVYRPAKVTDTRKR